MPHIEVKFSDVLQETSEILIALLSDLRYEGFEETENTLKAFIPASLFNKDDVNTIATRLQLKYISHEIPDTNWNAVWESNFQPVVIEDFCAVRAEFHEPFNNVPHEIIITPKMSFGTGHHATTFMMIQQMKDINFYDKHVLDFGTGTGVLAILANQLKAAVVTAIDNDPWSIENAKENFQRNDADDIHLKLEDHISSKDRYDIILANITRNVIQENFSSFNKNLNANGILLLSGLLNEDENAITTLATSYKFILEKKLEKDNWICLKFIKEE